MSDGYLLRIGWSRSVHYPAVQALAAGVPGAWVTGVERDAVLAVPLADATPATIVRLLHWVGDWRGTTLELDGVPLGRLALYHLATTMQCATARALGGAGALHCWGLPQGRRQTLPCGLLETILPYQPDATPAAAWTTAIQATARLQATAACPFYDPPALAAAVNVWAQGKDPASVGIAHAWQRWREDRTAARLLGDIDIP
jgi:hypothetical protein